jgi:S1-C subfamily serine protease
VASPGTADAKADRLCRPAALFPYMTGVDWAIIAFALLMGYWGYRHGLIVGLLSLVGFLGGAFLGSRIGPALLAGGSESPYAPVTALAGALLFGGLAAVSLEGVARSLRRSLLGPAGRRRGVQLADAAGGALLLAAVGLAIAWLAGAVALHAPNARDLRQKVQRSAILGELNDVVPPSGEWLNVLNRIDPGREIQGPDPGVHAPDSKLADDPEVRAASDSVVRVLGSACGLAVSGSGWIAGPGIVVTAAHVVAGEQDTVVSFDDQDDRLDATPIHYDSNNDLAVLRVDGLGGEALPIADEVEAGTAGAVLGYPENGPFTIAPARAGTTEVTISEDSYGRGPIRRLLTSLRGEVRRGNSGGPLVDGAGRVMGTVFASTTRGRPGGYAVPDEVVAGALDAARGGQEVTTGPCV